MMRWTRERILSFIQNYAVDGYSPSRRSSPAVKHAAKAATREFGSWRAAVEAAGCNVRPSGQPRATDYHERVLEAAREVRVLGISRSEAAAHFGVSRHAVGREIQRTAAR